MENASSGALARVSGMKMHFISKLFFLGTFIVFGISCATYQNKVGPSKSALRQGNSALAVEKLKPLADKESDDQLVYLLDYGVANQIKGDYEESNKAFLQAHDLAEIVDYHSVTRITGSLLLNEGLVQYKGEIYENILINFYLALNFLMMGNLESALVETRRINEKLEKLYKEQKKEFYRIPMAEYLKGLIWEADGKWDDAYISYNRAFNMDPELPDLKESLLKAAWKSRRMKEFKALGEEFEDVDSRVKRWKDRDWGELVVIYHQGWGPEKVMQRGTHRFAKLRRVYSSTQNARVTVSGADEKVVKDVETQPAWNVTRTAIQTYQDQIGALVAKRVAGIAAKAVVADQIRQNNEALGDLAWIVMNVADQADLRGWSTLPNSFQIARIPLKKGIYKVDLEGLGSSGGTTSEGKTFEVEIKPRKKAFLSWRSVQ